MTADSTQDRSWQRIRDVRLWRAFQIEAHLSDRQVQVAILLVLGRTLGEIANELQISRWTVVTHIRRLKKRLGEGNRCRLTVALLVRSGLLLGE